MPTLPEEIAAAISTSESKSHYQAAASKRNIYAAALLFSYADEASRDLVEGKQH